MPGFDVSIKVTSSYHDFTTHVTFVRWCGQMHAMMSMQSNVFIQITGITEWTATETTLQWLVSSVSSQMDLETVI